jgi:sulfite dehydrogenase (cytochrome) subunit B
MRSAFIAITAAVTAFIGISATAEEKLVRLKQAPGLDKVEAHCGACHSLDYVQMNSPFLTAAGWDAEVAKMINAFGAQIDQADAKVIADYLAKNYGNESLPALAARPAGIKPSSLEKEKSVPEPSSHFEIAHEKYDTKRAGISRVVVVPRTSNHASLRRTLFENRDPSVCSAFQSCSGHEPLLLGVGF